MAVSTDELESVLEELSGAIASAMNQVATSPFNYRSGRYREDPFLVPSGFRTSVGDMFGRAGRGCSLAMCVERRFVGTCSPQNLHNALPAEI